MFLIICPTNFVLFGSSIVPLRENRFSVSSGRNLALVSSFYAIYIIKPMVSSFPAAFDSNLANHLIISTKVSSVFRSFTLQVTLLINYGALDLSDDVDADPVTLMSLEAYMALIVLTFRCLHNSGQRICVTFHHRSSFQSQHPSIVSSFNLR